jgi:aspartyl protease family protein
MIGWALKQAALWGGIVLVVVAIADERPALFRIATGAIGSAASGAHSARGEEARAHEPDRLVFKADPAGHVVVDAVVNGAPMRMLVDTGSTLVALGPRDAQAAGIDVAGLVFSGRASTAGGAQRLAPVTLREVRIGQLSLYDVPGAVLERLDVPLLGMSFLDRLQGYEMRRGELILKW